MEKKRNLWVIPTDKPSRLYLNSENKIFITDVEMKCGNTQNIYITSNEEIKEGDWCIMTNDFGDNYIVKIISLKCIGGQEIRVLLSLNNQENTSLKDNCKKIILTDNKDLIKDGVQSIDDEFLEWFVKNPSCEEVEVILDEVSYVIEDNIYKIIIPKEEPKQEIVGYRLKPSIDRMMVDGILKNSMPIWNQEDKSVYFIRGHIAGSLVAKMKELQVLDLWFTPIYENEEVKSDWLKENHLDYYYKEGVMSNESKQERMYSDEEFKEKTLLAMINIMQEYSIINESSVVQFHEEWFEQFKKK